MAEVGTSRLSTGPKLFTPPGGFEGCTDNWEDFSYKLKAYLSFHEPDFGQYMTRVEESVEPVVDEDKFLWARLTGGDGDSVNGL